MAWGRSGVRVPLGPQMGEKIGLLESAKAVGSTAVSQLLGKERSGMMTWPIIVAMKASLPERKMEWERIKKVEWLLGLGISRNDMMDMGVERGNKKREGYLDLHRRYLTKKEGWQTEVGDYIRELCFLETWAKNKDDWSADEVVVYRELVNAVSWMGILGVMYGKEFLAERRGRVNHLSLGGIEGKYRWMTEGSQSLNKDERVAKLWFNVIMAGQVRDDIWGRELDDKYGLVSLAKLNSGDLDKKRGGYMRKAEELGLTKTAAGLMDNAVESTLKALSGFQRIKDLPWMPKKWKEKAGGVFRREMMG